MPFSGEGSLEPHLVLFCVLFIWICFEFRPARPGISGFEFQNSTVYLQPCCAVGFYDY